MLGWRISGAWTRPTGSGRSPRPGPSAPATGAAPLTSSTPPRGRGRRRASGRGTPSAWPHRGPEGADPPVDGADIDAALLAAGLGCEPGDALCLDMGRDRFEAARGHM